MCVTAKSMTPLSVPISAKSKLLASVFKSTVTLRFAPTPVAVIVPNAVGLLPFRFRLSSTSSPQATIISTGQWLTIFKAVYFPEENEPLFVSQWQRLLLST